MVGMNIPIKDAIDVSGSDLRRCELSELALADIRIALNGIVLDLEQFLLNHRVSTVFPGKVIAGFHFIA